MSPRCAEGVLEKNECRAPFYGPMTSKPNIFSTSAPNTFVFGSKESPGLGLSNKLKIIGNGKDFVLQEPFKNEIRKNLSPSFSFSTLSPLSPSYYPPPAKPTYASVLKGLRPSAKANPTNTTSTLPTTSTSFSSFKTQNQTLTIRDLEKKFKTKKLNLFISSLLANYSELLTLF